MQRPKFHTVTAVAAVDKKSTPSGPLLLPPKLRTRRACETCRLQKAKCDGRHPCLRCKSKGLLCLFGLDSRSVSISSPLKTCDKFSYPEAAAHSTGPYADKHPFANQVHCSVSGSDVSSTAQMNLYYGPSSCFAFLQQIQLFLSGGIITKDTGNNSLYSNYNAEVISEFGYHSQFFGARLVGMKAPKPLESLPLPLALKFLELYVSSTQHILPFISSTTLERMTKSLYSPSSSNLDNSDCTLVLAILAIGADMTPEAAWADTLYTAAESTSTNLSEAVDIRNIQTLMVLGEFQLYRGRPNSAQLTVGSAVLKALAGGLNHDTFQRASPAEKATNDELSRVQERCATFWSLFAQDRKLSLLLGRPAVINEADIDLPKAPDAHLKSLIDLSEISNDVYKNIYRSNRGTLEKFCEKIQRVRESMRRYRDALTEDHWFPFTKEDLNDQRNVFTPREIVMVYDYSQIMLIALRPCLILDAIRRQKVAEGKPGISLASPTLTRWLDETSSQCTAVAANVIAYTARALDTSQILKYMGHSRFFVETACFILLFDVIRTPHRPSCDANFAAVEQGLRCFANYTSDGLVTIAMNAVSRIMADAKVLVAKARSAAAAALMQQQLPMVPPISIEPLQPLSSAATSMENLVVTDGTRYMFNGGAGGSVQETHLPIVEGNLVDLDTDSWFWNTESLDNDFFDQGYFLWTDEGREYPC